MRDPRELSALSGEEIAASNEAVKFISENPEKVGSMRVALEDREHTALIVATEDNLGNVSLIPLAIIIDDDLFNRLTPPR